MPGNWLLVARATECRAEATTVGDGAGLSEIQAASLTSAISNDLSAERHTTMNGMPRAIDRP